MTENLSAADSMARALHEEEEERRLDNEAGAHEIDRLRAEVKRLSAPSRIVVVLEGGLVQNVYTTDGEPVNDVIVIDYDTEGTDPDDEGLTMLPQAPMFEGDPAEPLSAWVSRWPTSEIGPLHEGITAKLREMFGPETGRSE